LTSDFQPMNVNFGLFPPVEVPKGKRKVKKADRKLLHSERAIETLKREFPELIKKEITVEIETENKT